MRARATKAWGEGSRLEEPAEHLLLSPDANSARGCWAPAPCPPVPSCVPRRRGAEAGGRLQSPARLPPPPVVHVVHVVRHR